MQRDDPFSQPRVTFDQVQGFWSLHKYQIKHFQMLTMYHNRRRENEFCVFDWNGCIQEDNINRILENPCRINSELAPIGQLE